MTRPLSEQIDAVEHLRQIYGDAAAVVAGRIDAVIKTYAGKAEPASHKARLDERDVLLITYGDTFYEADVAPLKTLDRFYRQYLQETFDLVHVLPFHPFSSDDGFAVIDYYEIRDDLGDWDDIRRLSHDCRVMADAVVNHMSSESNWFRRFLDGDPDFADFFVEGDPAADLSAVVRPRTTPLLTDFEDAEGKARHIWTTFSADQVDLNFRNPDVLVAIIDVLANLVSKGASLLRLDAVTFLWKEPGTSCANLDQTHRLIKIMRAAISALQDDVVIITETNVPHRENIAYFGDGHDEAHMVYNFALPPLIAQAMIAGDSRHLRDWARQLTLPSDDVCFLNFSASHDGVGVRPVEEILDHDELQQLLDATLSAGGQVSSRTLSDGKEHPYELNCTFLDLISRSDDDVTTTAKRFIASQAIVLSMPGIPAIYIQSLLGTRNDLQGVADTGRARSINRPRHRFADVERRIGDPKSLEGQIFARLTELIHIRRTRKAFDPYAHFEILDLGPDVFALRRGDGADSIHCIINVTDATVTLSSTDNLAGRDLISDRDIDAGNLSLDPFAVVWIAARS